MSGSTASRGAGVRTRLHTRLRTRLRTRRPAPRFAHPRPNQALNRGKQDTQGVIEERGKFFANPAVIASAFDDIYIQTAKYNPFKIECSRE